MLTLIVQHSSNLVAFIDALKLELYQPQMRHLLRVVDALLVSNQSKTISALYRLFQEKTSPKNGADFFRESPWQAEDIGAFRKRWMMKTFLELASKINPSFKIFIKIDDSLGKKGKATRHLEAVDLHHNHLESTRKKQVYSNGYMYVEVGIQVGPFDFLFDTRLYLREKTVRRLNRKRPAEKRLHFRTKYALARQVLVELATFLPKGHQVYVLFDSWYASEKLIKFCRRQSWHVICAVKSNRTLDKVKISQHNQSLKHRSYKRITLETVDENRKPPRYLTRSLQGYLTGIAKPVHAIISKKRPGDKRPKYFICTDLSLSVQEVLRYYQKRWSVEVDNLYLKHALGLGDFRLQSFEAIEKWFAVVVLAINYLQYRMALAYAKNPSKTATLADFIRIHRLEHFKMLLAFVLKPFASAKQIEIVLTRVLPTSAWAVL